MRATARCVYQNYLYRRHTLKHTETHIHTQKNSLIHTQAYTHPQTHTHSRLL